jgi:cyclophilin family peptidyl-prolyl cis-trans isomerase
MKTLPLFLIAAAFAFTSCSEPTENTEPPESPVVEAPAPEAPKAPVAETEAPEAAPAEASTTPRVLIETSAGNITLELDAEKAPATVENFLAYANEGFYDNTVFHRVIEGFMVQGGGFGLSEDGKITQKETKSPIQNEAQNGLKNTRGTIAMARTGDPHSATAQFFINHGENSNLDYPSFDGWGYAVFGKVVEGIEIVDQIAAMETTTKVLTTKGGDAPMKDVPAETVVIKSIKKI